MAHNYPKILAPFARDNSNDKHVNLLHWSKPEFEVLKDIRWQWTAKADGTSIGLRYDGERVSFVGHTDKSKIPSKLLKYLQDSFGTSEAESIFEDLYGSVPVTVYGEGLSSETNENYGHPDGYFIVFDIKCDLPNGRWWDREAVHDFSKRFSEVCIEAPVVIEGSISSAIDYIKYAKFLISKNYKPTSEEWTEFLDSATVIHQWQDQDFLNPYDKDRPLEGLVGRPYVELMGGNGERIICKVKCKDIELNIN